MKHTKGKWYFNGQRSVVFHSDNDNTKDCDLYEHQYDNIEEMIANAKLIAEAGTVTNETGFTPRQLADQKAELLKACKLASKMYKDVQPSGGWQFVDDSLTEAIQKATP